MAAPDIDPQQAYRNQAIHFWEGGRLWYCAVLVLAALLVLVLLSGMRGFDPMCLLQPLVLIEGALCFVAANICYSFGYVPELLVMGRPLEPTYRQYRKALWLLGTLGSGLLAFVSTVGLVRFACGS